MNQEIIKRIENITGNLNISEAEIVLQLKNLIFELDLNNGNARDSKSLVQLTSESIKSMQSDSNPDHLIRTGFANIDNTIGGISYGEMIVIGGRPSMGKTQLLVNLSLNISQTVPVLYFTFDLSEYLLTARFIASITNIAANKILQNNLTVQEKELLMQVESKMQRHAIYINDSCNNSVSNFKSHCQKQIEENGVKVIIVDYIQMMSANKYRNNRELEISYISRELKNIAKDFNVCLIATSQLSRAVESRGGTKRPHLSDLRESGAIEQDADKVIFIYRPAYYGQEMDDDGNSCAGLTELIIAKNRNGILGKALLKHDADFTMFKDFDEYLKDFSFSEDRLNEINKSPF